MAKKAAKRAGKAAPKTVKKAGVKKAGAKKAGGKAALAGGAKSASGPVSRRADFKKPGKVAIDAMPEPQRAIARAVDRVIRASVPGATSVVKWGNPCYYRGDDRAIAALMATRTGVNLALPGTMIPDPEKLLEGTGATMRHVKLKDVAMAKSDAVRLLIVAAAEVGLERM